MPANRLPQSAWRGQPRRRLLYVLDQGISSVTNFLPAVVALAVLDLQGIAEFTLIYTTITFAMNVVRAWACEPALTQSAGSTESASVMLALSAAVVLSPLCAMVVAALSEATLSTAMALCVVVLPSVSGAEALRTAFLGHSRPACALAVDVAWLLSTALGLGAVAVVRPAVGLEELLALWGVAAAVSLVGGMLFLRTMVTRAGGVLAVFGESKKLMTQNAAAVVVDRGFSQAVLLALGAAGATDALGVFGVCRTVLAPIQVVSIGLSPLMIAMYVRLGWAASARAVRRYIGMTQAAYAFLAAALFFASRLPMVPAVVRGVGPLSFSLVYVNFAMLAVIQASNDALRGANRHALMLRNRSLAAATYAVLGVLGVVLTEQTDVVLGAMAVGRIMAVIISVGPLRRNRSPAVAGGAQ